MNLSKHKLALFVWTISLILSFGVAVAAEAPLDWLVHGYGSSAVFAQLITEGEETLLMDGVLKFAYPQGFQVQYFTINSPILITSQDGFVEVQTGIDAGYGYDRFWLFDDVQTYVFRLAELMNLPGEFSGTDLVASRHARRYEGKADAKVIFWSDEQTGLPLLIRQGKQTLVSVNNYTLDPENADQIASLELELLFADEPATITLELSDGRWVPARLVIQESLGRVNIDFSHWSTSSEWEENPLPRLAKLRILNDRFLVEFEQRKLKAALTTSQEMLSIAPQFWQAYLFQAFTYEGLDNFLGVVENYQQVLMRVPDHHLALNNLAYHYFLREIQIPQALEMAEKAVALERKDIYLDTLGYGYYLVGRYDEAKALLLEALETAPEEAVDEIISHLDLVLLALGEGE